MPSLRVSQWIQNISQAQISKIIQWSGFIGKTLGNLSKKVLLDLVVLLANDALYKLATKATSSVLNKFKSKNISNKYMNDII